MANLKGALYVRMSTEHQKYSIINQKKALEAYASKHEIDIVNTYSDSGKSGINIAGRTGLKTLLREVEDLEVQFTEVLVLDISRWGRFPDSDESAHYEYLLKRSGVTIHYCAEGFVNDGSIGSTIYKNVKRAMAAEYSKDLSKKVFIGQKRLIQLGYRQGGPSGFGLRRMLIDEHGNTKGILGHGQRKSIQTDRVILVPGPSNEIEIINQIYIDFVQNNNNERAIADKLNSKGIFSDKGREWTSQSIHQILINEKYIGNNVFNRTSFKLKIKRVNNDPKLWVRADGVFEPIVDIKLFNRANLKIINRSKRYTDFELLDKLKALLTKHGYLAGIIINESKKTPSSSAYSHRFGSLIRAYELIGYTPQKDYSYIEVNKLLRKRHSDIVQIVVHQIKKLGSEVNHCAENDLIIINKEFSISIVIARHKCTECGRSRWKIRFDNLLNPTITIGVRMCSDNQSILDYFLLPHYQFNSSFIQLSQENGVFLDAYRFDSLELLYGLSERAPVKDIA